MLTRGIHNPTPGAKKPPIAKKSQTTNATASKKVPKKVPANKENEANKFPCDDSAGRVHIGSEVRRYDRLALAVALAASTNDHANADSTNHSPEHG